MTHGTIRSVAATLLVAVLGFWVAGAEETERVYLSGRGKDDAVPWRFMCTTGALSGFWTNIPVPSNWDVKGFGHLTYKKDFSNAITECGLYERDFYAPKKWKGKRVFLVFDGVMTDTSAKLNGESVGPMHQGGFYRFKYEVTDKLKLGAENQLEVTVAKHSANESVNKAERLADYWVFGGIYRPVYLEVVPQQFIERVAIDAKADGAFALNVFLNCVTDADSVEAQIVTLNGKKLKDGSAEHHLGSTEEIFETGRGGARRATLTARIASPKLWTAETPNLYRVEVRLKRGKGTLHQLTEQFGFRTFEVRDGDGLYLNGQRIILKGVNRHSFWPDSGRCLSDAVHRLDITTIKEMNGNAVRMSHYPPDAGFLDLCDELGLYVLDELAGWHNAYDTEVGTKLAAAMVERDVNHPSILFWDNGNEGGSNPELDRVFQELDPQKRRVLHPWGLHSGLNTAHYLAYTNAKIAASGAPMYYHAKENAELLNTNLPGGWIYMPTEFMHGLYDGGAGAGLEDYWGMMMSSSNCAGGFIWAFADEGIKRPDTGQIDVAGNQAPDGIVGPYREREGSFYAIKELWSPIQVTRVAAGAFKIENNFSFTDVNECEFTLEDRNLADPFYPVNTGHTVRRANKPKARNLPPGASGIFRFRASDSSNGFEIVEPAAAMALVVKQPGGREMQTWVWPNELRRSNYPPPNNSSSARSVVQETPDTIEIKAGTLEVEITKRTGLLARVGGFSFTNGPRPVVGEVNLKSIAVTTTSFGVMATALFDGGLDKVVWTVRDDGWLQCDYKYTATGTQDFFGVVFDYPENLVKKKRWLGDGPFRVWKNRLRGVTLGVWENDYNNTITGYRDWIYPEFKGCFANVRWLQLETKEGLITVVPENIPYVQVLTPEQPPDNLIGKTKVNLPKCGLGFLHAIPPIGTKFKPADQGGPQGQPNVGQGEYSGSVSFYFGPLPK